MIEVEVENEVVQVGDRLVHEIERSEDRDDEHQGRKGEGDREVEEVRAAHGGGRWSGDNRTRRRRPILRRASGEMRWKSTSRRVDR